MKNRLIKRGRMWLAAISMLYMCGFAYSCSDDYDLPDKKPGWLGPSIFDYLESDGNYTNTVRLIQDIDAETGTDIAETLRRTGSRTMFVADDNAFAEFFKNNTWGVSKYEDLTLAMKKLLLNSSMLNNAYLLEMMTNVSAGNTVSKNQCLRQPTLASANDSIPYFVWSSEAIPHNFHVNDSMEVAAGTASIETDYWVRFRTQEKGGVWLALDGTTPFVTHFLAGQMGEANITDDDFSVFAGTERQPSDAHIYASKVIEQDLTCLNGYIDKLDRVLVTPPNMAEMIRTCGKTNIFSHILDRFSAPYYNSVLTSSHAQLTGIRDSVFEKRYMSQRSRNGEPLNHDPDGNPTGENSTLVYDPGWNGYYPPGQSDETDMGAMFVPSDDVLATYFLPGGAGQFLMETYAKRENTRDNLLYNIDQIPLNVIQAFVNNLMKPSFIGTVPSKYITIMNDARDPMFSSIQGGVDGFKTAIDTVLLANNGAVYIMNQVIVPAKYAAVSSPALVRKDTRIFNYAVTCDDEKVNDPNNAPLNMFYSFYLLAMSSRFSLFVPTDAALSTYYDLVTSKMSQPRALRFTYSTSLADRQNPVKAEAYPWDPVTNEVGSRKLMATVGLNEIKNRLIDFFDTHVIVHSGADAMSGLGSLNQYYVTKGGSAVRISNTPDGKLTDSFDQTKTNFYVQGGFQIDNDSLISVLETYDRRQEITGYGNGMTYIIDRPIQTTMKSVFSVLNDDDNEDSPFREFFELCQIDADILSRAGFADTVSGDMNDQEEALEKYLIFTNSRNGLTDNVRFFNTFQYTVYVPTNEAIREAISNGLPTWDVITETITSGEAELEAARDEGLSEEEQLAIEARYKTKAQAMITCLVNFLKYHFQDNSVFADRNVIEPAKYETACLNNETNRYRSVKVSSTGNGTLSVSSVYRIASDGSDITGPERHVLSDENLKNILTRDYELSSPATSNASKTINTSSYAVVHQIDGVLNFKELDGGRYDSDWADTKTAKKFVAAYRIWK